jgi:hypothetical protein
MTLSPKREELNHWNQTYTAMQSRAGHGEMDAVNLVLVNNEVKLPQTGSEFCAYLEGIHVVGHGSRHAQPNGAKLSP